MSIKLQLRRGLETDLPSLAIGEPGFCTNSYKMFIGSAAGNKGIAMLASPTFTGMVTVPALTLSTINLTLPGGSLNNFFMCGSGADQVGNTTCTGNGNIALGSYSGLSLTTAVQNTLVGVSSGQNFTTGYGNVLIGCSAGYSLISSNANTLIGHTAGSALTIQSNHTYVGFEAGLSSNGLGGLFPGGPNDFFGARAGRGNTEGYFNVFIGANAGATNTTGFENTFVGNCAGMLVTTGQDDAILGQYAGGALTTGWCNTFIGQQAGGYEHGAFHGFITGNYNTLLGGETGQTGDGSRNVFIGYQAGFYETGSNTLIVDSQARASESVARIQALIYGIFDAATANQRLSINARLLVRECPNYANNAAAIAGGLTSGELYTVTGTDPLQVAKVV